MPVFRIEKNNNYTTMSNHHLRDKNLTLKAKGLLSLFLSLPDSWQYSINGLVAICKEGRSGIASGLKELEQGGYLVRERHRDAHGLLRDNVYVIYERPMQPEAENPALDNPALDNPVLEKPTLEKPVLDIPAQENRPQIIKEVISKEESNTDSNNKREKAVRHKYGVYGNVLLSDRDFATLQEEYPYDWAERIERLSEYMDYSGKTYRNHLKTIQAWAKRDREKSSRAYNPAMYQVRDEDSL